ncbi:MAG: hypothetical protein ACOVSR_12515 [Bacteroidia bacterium]
MKSAFCIFFLLTQLAANAQFKLGTFGVGANADMKYDRFEYDYIGNINLGLSASVFLSPKIEFGLGTSSTNIISNIKSIDSDNWGYATYLTYYFPVNSKTGFNNQILWSYSNRSKKDVFVFTNGVLENNLGFYMMLYKGLNINVKYSILSYKTSTYSSKSSDGNMNQNTQEFNLNLNPLYILNAFQIGLSYYFNTTTP